MDQNYRTVGGIVTIVILCFCTFLCLGLGIAFLFANDKEVLFMGYLLLAASVLLIFGIVKSIKSVNTERKASLAQLQMIYQNSGVAQQKPAVRQDAVEAQKAQLAATATVEEPFVLATWVYTTEEWKQFMMWEKKQRKSGTLIEAALIVVVGIPVLIFLKGAGFWTAFAICVTIAVFYGIMKYIMMMNSISSRSNKLSEVVITREWLLVNSHMNRFFGENLWLGKVLIKEEKNMNILEVTYCWETRGGKTSDEIRVPIPKGKLKEAVMIQEDLKKEYSLST